MKHWQLFPTTQRWLTVYASILLALALVSLFGRPIIAVDNDLWFHLAHGRYLFSEGEIPTSSYFSFVSPQKEGVNYYWLFQALVYSVFASSGYIGVIAFRGLLYLLFLLVIGRYLFRNEKEGPRLAWLAFIFGLYLQHSIHKYMLVRPHSLSFLFILLFIYILEAAPNKALWLPPLALLWVNFHGIEYPVLIVITGAYGAELVWKSLRHGDSGPARTRQLAALLLSMVAIFMTPHGLELVRLPFQSTGFVSNVINEMSRLGPAEYFAYQLSLGGFTTPTLSNLFILIGLVSAGGCLVRQRLRISHLLMLGGGLFLLAHGVRFTHECSLLLLPLMKTEGIVPRDLRWPLRPVARALVILTLATPFPYLAARLPSAAQSYPLSLDGLPHGTASFLSQIDAEGKVMNNPNLGGYLLWALYPRYQIFMDLEVAFLFDENDMFELASSFYDRESLRKFLVRYDPEIIAAPIAATGFPALIARHPEYRLVFFDDTGVVYVDSERYPEIAESHGLDTIDPYSLAGQRFSSLEPARRSRYLSELERMIAIDPDISSINQSAAILYNLDRRYPEAIARADAVIEKQPQRARAYAIKGDALTSLGRVDEAADHYRRALEISTEAAERRAIQRAFARCLSAAERFDEAYEQLAAAVGEFNIEASYTDLYNLGVLAAASGRPDQARRMLRFARLKVPPEEDQWRRRIEENLSRLDGAASADR